MPQEGSCLTGCFSVFSKGDQLYEEEREVQLQDGENVRCSGLVMDIRWARPDITP